ncbi:uncharacterized protein LAJ45_04860 [Morchella importuna]|uniref:uncharacterized protein n=1 Tax=Morchella importuna TaxID=1174673 RepID=UPI001E8DC32A|nr:uncharacterized protein LAJ45_04860 [Morchella importuna]KAH8151158.1 hypothetical protein LAJ45_04860 [Morchella importuna]
MGCRMHSILGAGTITTTIYTTRCYNYTSITYSEPGVSYSHHPSNQATKQPTILLLFHLRPPPSKIPIPFPWTDLMCAIHLRAAFNRLILRWFSPSHVQTSLPPAIRYTTPHQLKATPLPATDSVPSPVWYYLTHGMRVEAAEFSAVGGTGLLE